PVHASHMRRYGSQQLATERLGTIAAGARTRVSALPEGPLHEAILAGVGGLYPAPPGAWRPGPGPAPPAVFAALGPLARPSLVVHMLRRGGRGGGAILAARRRSHAGL